MDEHGKYVATDGVLRVVLTSHAAQQVMIGEVLLFKKLVNYRS